MSRCSKPGCSGTAAAVLSYDYASSRAVLDDPPRGGVDPHLYVLCAHCADRLTPPRGWTMEDRRETPPLFLPRDPSAMTVDVVEVIGPEVDAPEEVATRSRQLFFGHSA